ncbi:hypothetical protein V8D89_007441 [Ganoderma adspersum]
MPASAILSVLFLASQVSTVYAQASNVTCPDYIWLSRLGQGNASQVNTLPTGYLYVGPGKPSNPDVPQCECNTVVYSLLAACVICQKGRIQIWPVYSASCAVPTNGSYPEPIPVGTAVPEWAFLDVIRNSTFNEDAAKAVALQTIRPELPDIVVESSSVSSSTSTSTSRKTTTDNTGTCSQNLAPDATQSSPPVERSRKNVGAIVGGVLGAVIGVLLVGISVLCIMLRRQRQTPGGRSFGTSRATGVRELPSSVTPSYHVSTLKGEAGSIRGFYDPNDPRTYPATQSSGSGTGYTGLPQVMS